MVEGLEKGENRNLKIILGALCALAVLLGVGVGVVTINNNSNSSVIDDEDDDLGVGHEKSVNYIDEAEKIYGDNPENTEKVIDYFVGVAEESPDDADVVSSAVWSMWKFFMDKGDNSAALNGMQRIDVTPLDDIHQYLYYEMMTSLAYEAGETELAQRYEPLRDEKRGAYDAYVEATERHLEEVEREEANEAEANKAKLDDYWKRMAEEEEDDE